MYVLYCTGGGASLNKSTAKKQTDGALWCWDIETTGSTNITGQLIGSTSSVYSSRLTGGGWGGGGYLLLRDISLAPKLFAKLIVVQAINQLRFLNGNRLPARLQDPFT